jgi:hypothetical protein
MTDLAREVVAKQPLTEKISCKRWREKCGGRKSPRKEERKEEREKDIHATWEGRVE